MSEDKQENKKTQSANWRKENKKNSPVGEDNLSTDEENKPLTGEEYKEKCDDYLKGWQRAKADFLNYKREEKERVEFKIIRNQEIIFQKLIMILDSFDLSLLSSDKRKIDKKGVELIRNQLFDLLKKEGLEKINVELGDEFDPNIHEVIEKNKSKYEPDKVIEEIEKGYMFKGKIIRSSKVKISKE